MPERRGFRQQPPARCRQRRRDERPLATTGRRSWAFRTQSSWVACSNNPEHRGECRTCGGMTVRPAHGGYIWSGMAGRVALSLLCGQGERSRGGQLRATFREQRLAKADSSTPGSMLRRWTRRYDGLNTGRSSDSVVTRPGSCRWRLRRQFSPASEVVGKAFRRHRPAADGLSHRYFLRPDPAVPRTRQLPDLDRWWSRCAQLVEVVGEVVGISRRAFLGYKTRFDSVHAGPAASRSRACRARWARSSSSSAGVRFGVLRERLVSHEGAG